MPLDPVTQITCQDACLNHHDCVGVSCSSYAKTRSDYTCDVECYLCRNQSVEDGYYDKGDIFINKPGNQ